MMTALLWVTGAAIFARQCNGYTVTQKMHPCCIQTKQSPALARRLLASNDEYKEGDGCDEKKNSRGRKRRARTSAVMEFLKSLQSRFQTRPSSTLNDHMNAKLVTEKNRSKSHAKSGIAIPFVKRWMLQIRERYFPSLSPLRSNQTNVIAEDDTLSEKRFDPPVGPRWAVSNNTTNLSGRWKPIITSAFKKEYDQYLSNCSQPFGFRTLCLHFVGLTREEIKQQGRELQIKGTNPVGVWERTLISSGSDNYNEEYEPINSTFKDPDDETVHVESWWQDEGTVHKSWLRGKPRVCGGEFESTRYLEDEDILVCESVFHPNGAPKRFSPAVVKWKFQRE